MPIRVLFLLTGFLSAQPLTTPRLSCSVENTLESTILTASVKGSETSVKLRIDWQTPAQTNMVFRQHAVKNNSLISRHKIGSTSITRTIFADAESDCIFLHVLADQPGPVHFSARFVSEDPVKIEDRRQLILSGEKVHAHAWIIPYESDVSDDGKSTITLAGEGEALIILNLTADPEKQPISDTVARLGQKHDPGHTPPSPHLIWEAVSKEEGESEGGGDGEKE